MRWFPNVHPQVCWCNGYILLVTKQRKKHLKRLEASSLSNIRSQEEKITWWMGRRVSSLIKCRMLLYEAKFFQTKKSKKPFYDYQRWHAQMDNALRLNYMPKNYCNINRHSKFYTRAYLLFTGRGFLMWVRTQPQAQPDKPQFIQSDENHTPKSSFPSTFPPLRPLKESNGTKKRMMHTKV